MLQGDGRPADPAHPGGHGGVLRGAEDHQGGVHAGRRAAGDVHAHLLSGPRLVPLQGASPPLRVLATMVRHVATGVITGPV